LAFVLRILQLKIRGYRPGVPRSRKIIRKITSAHDSSSSICSFASACLPRGINGVGGGRARSDAPVDRRRPVTEGGGPVALVQPQPTEELALWISGQTVSFQSEIGESGSYLVAASGASEYVRRFRRSGRGCLASELMCWLRMAPMVSFELPVLGCDTAIKRWLSLCLGRTTRN